MTRKLIRIDRQIASKLFACQRNALSMLSSYYEDQRARGSALVQMPMGSGKTGVMAISSLFFPQFKNVLIVSPADYLCDQIMTHIENKFWQDAHIDLPPGKAKNLERFQARSLRLREPNDCTIYICTAQSLLSLRDRHGPKYAALRNLIDVVLFDEGHHEPASRWAEAMRGLGKKTVLMTATPYRNDFREFQIEAKYQYRFHYPDAYKEHIVREVQFEPYDRVATVEKFVEELRAFGRTKAKEFGFGLRVLVRCASASEVKGVVESLNRKQPGCALGFHTSFPGAGDALLAEVPDLATVDPAVMYFVHQEMLLQGVDDSRFAILAVYGRLTNARQLIQQAGRIVRNRSRSGPEIGYVLNPDGSPYERWWRNYLAAEQDPEKWRYLDKEFRGVFDPRASDFHEHLKIAYAASVFDCHDNRHARQLAELVKTDMKELSFRELNSYEDDEADFYLCIYEVVEQLPFLLDMEYTESRTGYFVVHRKGNLIFFFDSRGYSPESIIHAYPRVDPGRLQGLFSGARSRFTDISLTNCDTSQGSVRQKFARAYSIEDSVNSIGDYLYFCSAVRGRPGIWRWPVRRYVGFTRGRVNDSQQGDLGGFLGWTGQVAATINGKSRKARLFDRYAELARPPANPHATSILLDIDDIRDDVVDSEGHEVREMGDLCVEVVNDLFKLVIDGKEFDVAIHWDPDRRAFRLESNAFHRAYRVRTSGQPRSLLSHLNREQCFLATIRGTEAWYSHGFLFRPRIRFSSIQDEADVPMRDAFVLIEDLGHIRSEKGGASASRHAGWQADSLFGLIDRCTRDGVAQFPRLSWLVCDDAGKNEIADFIGIDSVQKRVVFIHTKSEDRLLSGSFFHEICGQVKKNLSYVHRHTIGEPPNMQLWDGRWTVGGGFRAGDYVRRRIRRPAHIDGEGFWRKVREMIQEVDHQVEVLMVIGEGFEFHRYLAELRKDDPAPQVVQIAFQLQSALDATTQFGARLRILCRP